MPSSLGFLLHQGLTGEDWGGRSIFSKESTWKALSHLMRCGEGSKPENYKGHKLSYHCKQYKVVGR